MTDFAWLTPSHFIMTGLLMVFAIAHSGLAALRPRGESLMGARGYRILFALVSIPLAIILIVYFINHRYDGARLWNLQGLPWMPALIWSLSAISFLFLYPATFNLLEIAAIQKPEIHLYETGIIRITRHPQMIGQVIWCIAHSLWLGTTFTLITSAGLITHHLFAVWHGDHRWTNKYGEAFETAKARTSVIPFQALIQGRQSIKLSDFLGEFLKPAYAGIALFIALFWWIHPSLVQASQQLHW